MTQDDNNLPHAGKAEIINPPNILKKKAGTGGISAQLLERAQTFIENNDLDFSPFAATHIEILEKTLKALKKEEDKDKKTKLLNKIIDNIMQIKSHGGMFNYQIMSEISGIALTFLEDTKIFNNDLYEIIEAHNKSIQLIISHSIKGNGGDKGNALIKEFQKATLRFQKKHCDK